MPFSRPHLRLKSLCTEAVRICVRRPLSIRNLGSEAGFALSTVTFASAIVIASLTAMGTYEINRSRQMVIQKSTRERAELAENIYRILQNPSAVYASAIDPRNSSLRNCLDVEKGSCSSMGTGRETEFALIFPIDSDRPSMMLSNPGFNLDGGRKVGSTSISHDGKVCARPSHECPYRVRTFFSVRGNPTMPTDPPRGTINISFRISREGGYSTFITKENYKEYNSALELQSISYQPDTIDMAARYLCPPNAIATGIDNKGNLICECKRHMKRDPNSPLAIRPKCIDPISCTGGKILSGMSNNGPICVDYPLSSRGCIEVPLTNPRRFGCMDGGPVKYGFRGLKDYKNCKPRWLNPPGREPDRLGRNYRGQIICDKAVAVCCPVSI